MKQFPPHVVLAKLGLLDMLSSLSEWKTNFRDNNSDLLLPIGSCIPFYEERRRSGTRLD